MDYTDPTFALAAISLILAIAGMIFPRYPLTTVAVILLALAVLLR